MRHPLGQHQQLYHRSNTTHQQKTAVISEDSSTKPSPPTDAVQHLKQGNILQLDSCPAATNKYSFKRFLSLLIAAILLSCLIAYSWALFYFDWPPDGTLRKSDGSPDLSQGDWWISPNLTGALHYMLVVAHPDDESLFFSPTLLNLATPRLIVSTESNATLWIKNSTTPSPTPRLNSSYPLVQQPSGHILCLSSGNADGLGFRRTTEMKASCLEFGIASSKCIIMNDADLPDSMSVWWSEEKIARHVKFYLDLWKINVIITFDHQGVSKHGNHRAIAAALKGLVRNEPTFPPTFMLRSSSLIEKYSWLVSLPLSLYRHHRHLSQQVVPFNDPSEITDGKSQPRRMSKTRFTSCHHSLILSSPRQYLEARRSFGQHVSQNVWFRRLWLVFSRYMWINELVRVV